MGRVRHVRPRSGRTTYARLSEGGTGTPCTCIDLRAPTVCHGVAEVHRNGRRFFPDYSASILLL